MSEGWARDIIGRDMIGARHDREQVVDPFVARLAVLCREHPTRPKWVFVPSLALGHTLGERLALGGVHWANLRFARPFDVALEMAAPFLLERGIDPAGEGIGPALVMRLLLDLPPATPVYFRALAEQPRMAEALWATLRELRMAGIGAADLKAGAFASAEKHAELGALLAAYERHLATSRLADAADVYREALARLDVGPVLPGDAMIELPEVIWSLLERRLLDALPAERMTAATRRVAGAPALRRLSEGVRPPAYEDATPETDAGLLAWLLRPAEAPAPRGDGGLAMFRAGGREAEVEEVVRRIVAAGVRLDQVEVACASPEYLGLFWEKAQRYAWPITIGPGLPVTLTRPARALLALADWVEGGFAAGALRRLLQSGDVRLDVEGGPTAGQAARLLARSSATWGRRTYAAALAALAGSYRERAAEPECDDEVRARYLEHAAHAEQLAAWIDHLLAMLPEEDAQGRLALGPLVTGLGAFLEGVAAKASELDGAAAVVLGEALRELTAVGALARPPAEAFALVRRRVEALRVGGDRARPGHLFVTALRQAGWAGRAHTFVVGLEEGGVFPPLLEDPVLLDAERAAIDPALPTSRDRAAEALHEVVSRLAALGGPAALGGRVCLSFSCRDLREHRETFPSWLLLQVQRLLRRDRAWTYGELGEALGEPVSVVPATPPAALGDAGWWLAHLRGVGAAGLPAVHGAFPWLAEGEAAEAARESSAFTRFDGFVPAAGARLDPRRSGRPVSATTLEDLAECPFRHFLRHGLGVEPIEDREPDRDRWLDPLTRGSLLHDLYAAILREVRDAGGRLESIAPIRA